MASLAGTRCLTRCLPRCHCITRRLSCCICFHCRFPLPYLSRTTDMAAKSHAVVRDVRQISRTFRDMHSHMTELHAPWRPPHFPSAPAFARLRIPVHGADFEAFCTQVGLRGGVYRVHKHARHGGVSWRGRGRQPIRQAATSTTISASVFQSEHAKLTSTASPTSTSRDGFGTIFSLSESKA
jgi:hypothetical protein